MVFYRDVVALRHKYPALRRGSFRVLAADNHHQLIAYERQYGDERLIVLLNRGPNYGALKIPAEKEIVRAASSLEPLFSSNGKLNSLREKKLGPDWALGAPPRTGGVWRVKAP